MTELLKRGWEQRKMEEREQGEQRARAGNSEQRPQAADLGSPGRDRHKRRGDRSQRGRARSKRCRRCCTAFPFPSTLPSLKGPFPCSPFSPTPFPFFSFESFHHSLPSHACSHSHHRTRLTARSSLPRQPLRLHLNRTGIGVVRSESNRVPGAAIRPLRRACALEALHQVETWMGC
ncbi:hypothetical protein M758_6G087500 [Ceratodon purpureus]|nr:hypothetical protein M758_6G087500 [Ceratodon purpureus]